MFCILQMCSLCIYIDVRCLSKCIICICTYMFYLYISVCCINIWFYIMYFVYVYVICICLALENNEHFLLISYQQHMLQHFLYVRNGNVNLALEIESNFTENRSFDLIYTIRSLEIMDSMDNILLFELNCLHLYTHPKLNGFLNS